MGRLGWGMFETWDNNDVGCLRCGMFGMWDFLGCVMFGIWHFRYIACWECGMFGMYDVWDVRCGIFKMRDIGNVRCWGYARFRICGVWDVRYWGIWDVGVVGCSRCGMFGMWNERSACGLVSTWNPSSIMHIWWHTSASADVNSFCLSYLIQRLLNKTFSSTELHSSVWFAENLVSQNQLCVTKIKSKKT